MCSDLWLVIHSVSCSGPAVLIRVIAFWADISCFISMTFPGSSGCSGAGHGRGQKNRGRWKDWAASQQPDGRQIWKIKKGACASCEHTGNHAFISWNIEPMREWKNMPLRGLLLCSLNRWNNSSTVSLLFLLLPFSWHLLVTSVAGWLTYLLTELQTLWLLNSL